MLVFSYYDTLLQSVSAFYSYNSFLSLLFTLCQISSSVQTDSAIK